MVDGIYGASTDNSRIDKDQVIRYCFDSIGFDADAGDRALMVGDRWTDVDGAIVGSIAWVAIPGVSPKPVSLRNMAHTASSIPSMSLPPR